MAQTKETTTTTTAGLFKLDVKDLLRGVLMAAIGSALGALYEVITSETGLEGINWKVVGGAALISGISYLLKNLGTPAEVVLKNPTVAQVESIKSGSAEIKVQAK